MTVSPGGSHATWSTFHDDQAPRCRGMIAGSVCRTTRFWLQLCRRMRPPDLAEAVALVGAGTVGLDGLVSHILPLAEVADAFEHLARRDGHKIVVRP